MNANQRPTTQARPVEDFTPDPLTDEEVGLAPAIRDEDENRQPALTGNALAQAVNQAEQMANLMPRLYRAIAKCTVPGDWSTFGQKGYLTGAASERVARVFGITFSNWRQEKNEWQDEKGEAYRWLYSAEARLGNTILPVEGMCSSRHKLWAERTDDKEGKYLLPPSEIDEANVRRAAMTDCIRQGVSRLLGLRGIHVNVLREWGINLENSDKVDFKSGRQGGGKSTRLATDGQRKMLYARRKKKNIEDDSFNTYLETTFNITSDKEITMDMVNTILEWIDGQPEGGF